MAVRRPCWAAVALLAVACGKPPAPPVQKPPKVTIQPLGREIVGTGFDASVEVIGCTVKVTRVWLTVGPDSAKNVLVDQEGGSTANTLRVESSFIDYKTYGIPAPLPLFAHATCAPVGDAGVPVQGDSEEMPTKFMPAQEVVEGPLPLGPNFWVDQDAASVLTCEGSSVKKVGKDKSVKASLSLPLACDGSEDLKFGSDGNRYLLKPWVGVVGFTAALQQAFYVSQTDFAMEQVYAPSSGPVVALGKDGGTSGILYQLRSYDPKTGNLVAQSEDSDQTPAGRLVVNRLGQTVFPGFKSATGSDYVDVGIELYDMAAGKGNLVDSRAFGQIFVDQLSVTLVPSISFDEHADVAYIAEIANPSHVYACSAVDNLPCTNQGGGMKWVSPALPGGVTTVIRTKHAMVAYGPRIAYFLDPLSGTPLTSLDAPIQPQGSLVFVAVLDGADGTTYLLAMGLDAGNHLLPGVKETLIYDKPNQLVSDFLTGTDGFIVDVDKTGRAWLWGYNLTPLLMAAEYRAALGR